MRILAIDPGSLKMGWAVVIATEANEPCLIAHGLFKLKPKDSIEVRCGKLLTFVQALIADHEIDAAVVEIPLVGGHLNYTSALTLGAARGAILAACVGLPVKSYNVSTWKSAVVGSQKAPKSDVQLYVQQYHQLAAVLSEDESDAAAMGTLYAMEMKESGALHE